jgi:hypothetical protein
MSIVEPKVIDGATGNLAARVHRLASRSPVLTQLRLNPFRVLRLPVSAGVDEAIWRAEELLTRMRAGLTDAAPDPIPWLAEPDEHEVRQAVQRVEEPLRRLADELFWFDIESDPHGELLQKAVSELSAADLNAYLASAADVPLPPPPPSTNGTPAEDDASAAPVAETDTKMETPGVTGFEAALALNQANVRLMLAALALVNALPEGVNTPGDALPGGAHPPAALPWKRQGGLVLIEDPHAIDMTDGRLAHRLESCSGLWSDALARWVRLLASPALAALVARHATQLGDDSVSEEDAEAIITAAESRLTDLVAGEIKAQVLASRPERVKVLVDAAAASGLEARRWVFALRTLRALFRSEAAELEPLLGDPESPRLDDIRLYLDRLGALSKRWAEMDRAGFLGLSEVADEAVVRAFNRLSGHENYGAIERLKSLLGASSALASADSLKHRIASAVARLDGLSKYACHFCRSNEMELDFSVVLEAKKETHRTYGFNSTTIHYVTTKDIVQRCRRCAELHDYLVSVANGTRICLGAVFVLLAVRIVLQMPEAIVAVGVFGGLVAAAVLWSVGTIARRIASMLVTPKGERAYDDITGAAQHKRLRSEGYTITALHGKNSFKKVLKGTSS